MSTKTKKAIELYSEIIKDLYDENFISKEILLKTPNILTLSEMLSYLLNIGTNHNIILKKVSEKTNLKKFNFNEKINKNDIIIGHTGVIFNNVFYFLNPFSKISQKFKIENEKNFGKYFFNEIGLISIEDFEKLQEIKRSTIKINNEKINNIKTTEVILEAIKFECEEVIFNKDFEKVLFNSKNNIYESNYKSSFSISNIDKVITYNRKEYYIKSEKINENLVILKINKYTERPNLEIEDKKYSSIVNNVILNSKGLFILSSKHDSDYYHLFLEKLRDIHFGSKIISIEKCKSKVNGIIQIKNISEVNDNIISESNIVCIENLDSKEKALIVSNSLNMGKFVFISVISKDSIGSLNKLLSIYPEKLNRNLISENLLAIYHIITLPLVCKNCSIDIKLKDHPYKNDSQFKFLYETKDVESVIKIANRVGCEECKSGYLGGILISEFLENDTDLSMTIEDGFNMRKVRNMKDSKRWENLGINAEVQLIKGLISLEDIKNKL